MYKAALHPPLKCSHLFYRRHLYRNVQKLRKILQQTEKKNRDNLNRILRTASLKQSRTPIPAVQRSIITNLDPKNWIHKSILRQLNTLLCSQSCWESFFSRGDCICHFLNMELNQLTLLPPLSKTANLGSIGVCERLWYDVRCLTI